MNGRFHCLKPGTSNYSLDTPISKPCRVYFVWAIHAAACSYNYCGAHGLTRPTNVPIPVGIDAILRKKYGWSTGSSRVIIRPLFGHERNGGVGRAVQGDGHLATIVLHRPGRADAAQVYFQVGAFLLGDGDDFLDRVYDPVNLLRFVGAFQDERVIGFFLADHCQGGVLVPPMSPARIIRSCLKSELSQFISILIPGRGQPSSTATTWMGCDCGVSTGRTLPAISFPFTSSFFTPRCLPFGFLTWMT